MPFIAAADAPVFTLPGVTFTGLASPSRGSRETAAWRLSMAPGTAPHVHRLTREEIFIGLSGRAEAQVGGTRHTLSAGCALVVPPGVDFSLSNPHELAFEAVAVLPVGGQAVVAGGAPFVPPWAA
ncbi:MAG: cupin domain-containing protein [Rhizobacter sp.]|nr:cupin domain-containing protein [Rhizobacter sp.]